jgi:hypothetical protein
MPAKRIALENKIFGMLTVTEFVGMNERRQSMYRVSCSCGETRIVRGSDLLTGKARSCGAGCKREREWQLRAVFVDIDELPNPRVAISTIDGRRGTTITRFGK